MQELAKAACRDVLAALSSAARKRGHRDEEDDEVAETPPALFVPELDVLGKLGSSGQYPNKIYGELMAKAEAMVKLPACSVHHFSFLKPRQADFKQLVMLPHVLFAHMYHNEKHMWQKVVHGTPERLEQFWAAVKADPPHPAWVNHPLRLQEEAGERSTSKCIALSLHGDEVPVAGLGKVWGRKMVNFSYSSLTGLGSTKNSQFWIWGLFEKVGVKNGPNSTLGQFFKVLRYSLYWLWLGRWPDVDASGEPCSGHVCALLFVLLLVPHNNRTRCDTIINNTNFRRTSSSSSSSSSSSTTTTSNSTSSSSSSTSGGDKNVEGSQPAPWNDIWPADLWQMGGLLSCGR